MLAMWTFILVYDVYPARCVANNTRLYCDGGNDGRWCDLQNPLYVCNALIGPPNTRHRRKLQTSDMIRRRMLSDVVGFCRIVSDCVGFCRIAGSCRFLSVFVGLCRIMSDYVGLCRIRSDSVGFGRILSDFVGLGRILSDFCEDIIRFAIWLYRCCLNTWQWSFLYQYYNLWLAEWYFLHSESHLYRMISLWDQFTWVLHGFTWVVH